MNEFHASDSDPREDLRLTYSIRLETRAGERIAEIKDGEAIGPAILSPIFLDTAVSVGTSFLTMNLVGPIRSLLRARIHALQEQVGFFRRGRMGVIPQQREPSFRDDAYRKKVAQAIAARRGEGE